MSRMSDCSSIPDNSLLRSKIDEPVRMKQTTTATEEIYGFHRVYLDLYFKNFVAFVAVLLRMKGKKEQQATGQPATRWSCCLLRRIDLIVSPAARRTVGFQW